MCTIMWVYVSMIYVSFQVPVLAQPYHHSAAGEYHVEWREFSPCPPDQRGTNEIFTDLHLTRRHRKAEIVGNLSNAIPFDDTVSLKVNFAVLGSNGAWIPNVVNMNFVRACSDALAGIFKEGWVDFMKSFNVSPACPVPKGHHQTKGYDADDLLKYSVLPKQFIYGRYKMIIEYYKRSKRLGCVYLILELVPIWQKKKTSL